MTNPRVVYEAGVIKLCIKGSDASYEALLSRIAELERRLDSGITVSQASAVQSAPTRESSAQKPSAPSAAKKPPVPDGELVQKVKPVWPEVMADISDSIMLYSTLENASLKEESGKLVLLFPKDGGNEMQDMVKDGLERVRQSVCAHTAASIDIITRVEDAALSDGNENDPLDNIIKLPITRLE